MHHVTIRFETCSYDQLKQSFRLGNSAGTVVTNVAAESHVFKALLSDVITASLVLRGSLLA